LSFLIDTNVISEPRRPQPDANVLSWFRRTDQAGIFISVLTLGELTRGAVKAARRDAAAGRRFQNWVGEVQTEFAERVLGIDLKIASLWGELSVARTVPVVDSLLAATALVHGMTLVTRNVRDVADTGVAMLNPWES